MNATPAHNKPQHPSPSDTSSSSLPANRTLEEVRHAVVERVRALSYKDGPSDIAYYLMQDISEYSEAQLSVAEAALQGEDSFARGVAEQISAGWLGHALNNTIHFYRKTGSDHYWRTIADVSALSSYDAVNTIEDLSTADESVQQQCIVLMKFTQLIDILPNQESPFLDYIDDIGNDVRVINDTSLVELIASRPEDVERIAAIVLDRSTSNGAAINEVLNGALKPVAEGHL